MQEWKDGDVIRWWYKDTQGMFDPYWCKSQIAIFADGGFTDTYWSYTSDRQGVHLPACEYIYLGNLNDYRPLAEYERVYYNDSDLLDLSHPNNSRNLYVKKTASKSVVAIEKALKDKLKEAQDKLKSSLWEVKRIEEKLQNVTADTYI